MLELENLGLLNLLVVLDEVRKSMIGTGKKSKQERRCKMGQLFVVSVYNDKMNFFQEAEEDEVIVEEVVAKGKGELSALLREIENKGYQILNIQTINNTISFSDFVDGIETKPDDMEFGNDDGTGHMGIPGLDNNDPLGLN